MTHSPTINKPGWLTRLSNRSSNKSRATKTILGFYLLFLSLGVIFESPVHAAPLSSLSLTMHNQQFSAHIIRAPLEQVLHTISSYGPIQFVIKGNVENDLVSSSFRHLSLEESLEKILVKYDFAIIHHQVHVAQNTSEFPYRTEVVILSKSRSETPSESKEDLGISHANRFSLPEPVFSSANLEFSDSLAPINIGAETHPREFLEEIEEALPYTDAESLALIKQLLEE